MKNYGWPTGPAILWLWLARRPFGWPRATGKPDPCVCKRIISFHLIVTLCDGELHFIDNQAVHSNLQNYNLSIGSLLIICTRYVCNNILYTFYLYRYVCDILWFFHCHADGHSIRALLSVLTGAVT